MPPSQDRGSPLPAVVLSCLGAPEGDLNVVRCLGECGVPVIVVGESLDAPSRASRYCTEFIHVPDFSGQPRQLLQVLEMLYQRHGRKLPVFATADPDLEALTAVHDEAVRFAHTLLLDPGLVTRLMNKRTFNVLAEQAGLPVPCTFTPASLEEALGLLPTLTYPIIIKPAFPTEWKHAELPLEISQAKAILAESVDALKDICTQLARWQCQYVIQEHVPGEDDEHYDVHVYMDQAGQARATYCGRKWRIYPAHAGSGCLVESLHEPALEAMAVDILQRIGFRGLANMNFKRHAATGEFKLLEINARVSQWNILPARSGVNLAWIAYEDACGLPQRPPPTRRAGVWYLHGKNDFRAMRSYRQFGEWSWLGYLRSLAHRPMVFQVFCLSDPAPALRLTARWFAEKMRLRRPS